MAIDPLFQLLNVLVLSRAGQFKERGKGLTWAAHWEPKHTLASASWPRHVYTQQDTHVTQSPGAAIPFWPAPMQNSLKGLLPLLVKIPLLRDWRLSV